MTCTHSRQREEYITSDDAHSRAHTDSWNFWTESTTVDLDTHRYKCTQCGKVMYYSGAAEDFYTRGIRRGPFG